MPRPREPYVNGTFDKAIWIILGVCLLLGVAALGVVGWALIRVVLRLAP